MNKPKDGGPAFPVPSGHARIKDYHAGHGEFEKTVAVCESGASLRDYFAAKAMAGELSSQSETVVFTEKGFPNLAKRCYEIADAMIAAREAS